MPPVKPPRTPSNRMPSPYARVGDDCNNLPAPRRAQRPSALDRLGSPPPDMGDLQGNPQCPGAPPRPTHSLKSTRPGSVRSGCNRCHDGALSDPKRLEVAEDWLDARPGTPRRVCCGNCAPKMLRDVRADEGCPPEIREAYEHNVTFLTMRPGRGRGYQPNAVFPDHLGHVVIVVSDGVIEDTGAGAVTHWMWLVDESGEIADKLQMAP